MYQVQLSWGGTSKWKTTPYGPMSLQRAKGLLAEFNSDGMGHKYRIIRVK